MLCWVVISWAQVIRIGYFVVFSLATRHRDRKQRVFSIPHFLLIWILVTVPVPVLFQLLLPVLIRRKKLSGK
ncbi:hypothetical protein C5167_010273 [Papaver somniferum]|uniref:Uncharacterized protein n=1 Tax=Papaver somniferum TaxID=3469 RepID=A0A4Y7K2K5_PAPSO|nr:hypothetical protein C5167_010273 [Papaver somniferum]